MIPTRENQPQPPKRTVPAHWHFEGPEVEIEIIDEEEEGPKRERTLRKERS